MCICYISPLWQRGEGGIRAIQVSVIPLNPPLVKGDFCHPLPLWKMPLGKGGLLLSSPAVEDALQDSESMRRLADIDLGDDIQENAGLSQC